MKTSRWIQFFMCLSALTMQAHVRAAKLYKWTDSEGKVHYSQFKPAAEDSRQTKTITVHSSPKPATPEQPEADGNSSDNPPEMSREAYCATREGQIAFPGKCMELNVRKADAERAKKKAEQAAQRKQQAAESSARIQRLQDQQTMAECRQRRETFCDEPQKVVRLCFQYQGAQQQCLNDRTFSSGHLVESCIKEKREAFRKLGAENCW